MKVLGSTLHGALILVAGTGLILAGTPRNSVAITLQQPGGGEPYSERSNWQVPPQEMDEVQRMGFQEGIVAAQDDNTARRRLEARARPEYRNPNLPPQERALYRYGFEAGYGQAVNHAGAFQPQPSQGSARPVRAAARRGGDASVYHRRGYQDGMASALHDLDHKKRPDPNNASSYREPKVPFPAVEVYRDGFRTGYDDGMRELAGLPESGARGDTMVRGYHDGAAGAVRDWDKHRPADPNNRNEYRKPPVAAEVRDAYRESFRRGYAHIALQLYGGSRGN